MDLDELINQKSITKYELSKLSGVPYSTLCDISTRKTNIVKCNTETLNRLAKALDVTMEDLIADSLEYRPKFETYKSNVCHLVKCMGDIAFIIDTLETDKIRKLYNKRWYLECLYLLAMVDYLSRENDVPLCSEYDDLRFAKMKEPVYPTGILVLCAAFKSDAPKEDSIRDAIPEFRRFNIIESDVRNVI